MIQGLEEIKVRETYHNQVAAAASIVGLRGLVGTWRVYVIRTECGIEEFIKP